MMWLIWKHFWTVQQTCLTQDCEIWAVFRTQWIWSITKCLLIPYHNSHKIILWWEKWIRLLCHGGKGNFGEILLDIFLVKCWLCFSKALCKYGFQKVNMWNSMKTGNMYCLASIRDWSALVLPGPLPSLIKSLLLLWLYSRTHNSSAINILQTKTLNFKLTVEYSAFVCRWSRYNCFGAHRTEYLLHVNRFQLEQCELSQLRCLCWLPFLWLMVGPLQFRYPILEYLMS